MNNIAYYKNLRNKYLPDKTEVILLLESPPQSGMFFYEERGRISEPLFAAVMEYLDYFPANKGDGLSEFRNRGYFLIDATYEIVNSETDTVLKNKKIVSNILYFLNDLEKYCGPGVKIIIVKYNVYMIYANLLRSLGYKVLNKGPIPFPLYKWRSVYLEKMRKLKREWDLN